MDRATNEWMAYIDAEVRAACEKKGWGSQIRRKWSVRYKPVFGSSIEDYEWKLIPGVVGRLPEQGAGDPDLGVFYTLSLDRRAKRLLLQHDTVHAGDFGLHFFQESFTAIHLIGLGNADYVRVLEEMGDSDAKHRVPVPTETGRLCDHLCDLTSRFKPNHFFIT